MAEVTDLHVLARMARGSPNEDDAFIIRDEIGNELLKIHSLSELVDALSNLKPEQVFPSLCRLDKDEFECDVAIWIHYVLGDAVLSAKVYNLVTEFKDNPEKLKIEVFNFCFNRYLNFLEVLEDDDDLTIFDDDPLPPLDL
ncbi:MAG: hypothetical protein JXA54_13950 [Candidatus Heimdallarchaeota archaeon]|nr:hypothetical protein [Candidatus Heimdallarchaeota archaeon]